MKSSQNTVRSRNHQAPNATTASEQGSATHPRMGPEAVNRNVVACN